MLKKNNIAQEQLVIVKSEQQQLICYEGDSLFKQYLISTGKNGMGEKMHSECTPRGWHQVYSVIGLENKLNSVFVARKWTGEIHTPDLTLQYPERDWILTRIIQLDGLEPGRNRGGSVDTLKRYIYIHGTPETTQLGKPGSRGCVRMRNQDIIEFSKWIKIGTKIYIQ